MNYLKNIMWKINMKKIKNYITALRLVDLPKEIRILSRGASLLIVVGVLLAFFPTVFWFMIGLGIFLFVSFLIGFLLELCIDTWKNLREDDDQYNVD